MGSWPSCFLSLAAQRHPHPWPAGQEDSRSSSGLACLHSASPRAGLVWISPRVPSTAHSTTLHVGEVEMGLEIRSNSKFWKTLDKSERVGKLMSRGKWVGNFPLLESEALLVRGVRGSAWEGWALRPAHAPPPCGGLFSEGGCPAPHCRSPPHTLPHCDLAAPPSGSSICFVALKAGRPRSHFD